MHDYSRHLNSIIQILEEAGFLYGLKPSEKGLLASRIYGENSLIITQAIAAGLAQKMSSLDAVIRARSYVRRAIETAPGFGRGHGPLNHAVTVK